MPYYLVQVAYTSEAWAAQLKNPQNRIEVLRPLIQHLGGKLDTAFFAFGEYDIVAIGEFPDNVSAAAFSLVASAGGAIKAIKTTPLVTIEEGVMAMRRGDEAASLYQPPAQQRWSEPRVQGLGATATSRRISETGVSWWSAHRHRTGAGHMLWTDDVRHECRPVDAGSQTAASHGGAACGASRLSGSPSSWRSW